MCKNGGFRSADHNWNFQGLQQNKALKQAAEVAEMKHKLSS